MTRAAAESFFDQVCQELQEQLRTHKHEAYPVESIQELLEGTQSYGVQEHFGTLPEYIVTPYGEASSTFTRSVYADGLLHINKLKVVQLNSIAAEFVGASNLDTAYYTSPTVASVIHHYREDILSQKSRSMSMLLVMQAGYAPSTFRDIFSRHDFADLYDLQLYLDQYATLNVAAHLQKVGIEAAHDEHPTAWLDAMMNYDELAQDLILHAQNLATKYQKERMSFSIDDDGYIKPS